MTDSLSELFLTVANWAASKGAKNIAETPGLWHGRTEPAAGLGPFDVKINAHGETIDGIPPIHAFIGNDEFFPGIVALINPYDGTVLASPNPGETEDGLIAHFKAQGSQP